MEVLLALTVGTLYATGFYLLLRRSLIQIIVGLALLTNGANLLIFAAAGVVRGVPPLAALGADAPPDGAGDPLPQAMILTAIVIGFGLQAFAMVLAYRAYRATGSDDVDLLRDTDAPEVWTAYTIPPERLRDEGSSDTP